RDARRVGGECSCRWAVRYLDEILHNRACDQGRANAQLPDCQRTVNQRGANGKERELPTERQLLPYDEKPQNVPVGPHPSKGSSEAEGISRRHRRFLPVAVLNISAKKPPSAPAGMAATSDKAMNHSGISLSDPMAWKTSARRIEPIP